MKFQLIRYVLKAAVRDKFFAALFIGLVITASLSVFTGTAAVTEQSQFAAVFAAGSLRIIGAFGLPLFVVFFIRRCFESRDIEFLLSRPVSRRQLVLSYAAAFSCLAVLVGLAQGGCLYVLMHKHFSLAAFVWIGSIIAENIILVNVAFFFSMVLSSAVSGCMAVMGFYVLTRMMGQILGIIDAQVADKWPVLETVMQVISAVMPRLDLMGQSSWLLYGIPEGTAGWGFIAVQMVVFSFLVTAASLIDFLRREF